MHGASKTSKKLWINVTSISAICLVTRKKNRSPVCPWSGLISTRPILVVVSAHHLLAVITASELLPGSTETTKSKVCSCLYHSSSHLRYMLRMHRSVTNGVDHVKWPFPTWPKKSDQRDDTQPIRTRKRVKHSQFSPYCPQRDSQRDELAPRVRIGSANPGQDSRTTNCLGKDQPTPALTHLHRDTCPCTSFTE